MTGYSIDVEALRTGQQSSSESKSEPPMPTIESPTKTEFSVWNLLCQAIDRILFISYLAIILIFMASYLGGAALASTSSIDTSWINSGMKWIAGISVYRILGSDS